MEDFVLSDSYESLAQRETRAETSSKVASLFLEWCPEGQTYVIGSSMLEVCFPDSDIDILCVGPDRISRSEFNASFFETLKSQSWVSCCIGVFQARVPIIKLRVDELKVDILYTNNNDEQSVLSLNGYRSNKLILELVPDLETFRWLLRVVKSWSMKRCIYSTVMGYLGGASWALLCAKVCILFPEAKGKDLVKLFFSYYSKWNWNKPVCLMNDHEYCISDGNFMAIYTPARPQSNSAYTLTYSGFRAIVKEIERAFDLCEGEQFSALFEEFNLFSQYKYCLRINLYARSRESLLNWKGITKSKFKGLIKNIESEYPKASVMAFTKSFSICSAEFEFGCAFLIGLDFLGFYRQINFQDIVFSFCAVMTDMQTEQCCYEVKFQHVSQIEFCK